MVWLSLHTSNSWILFKIRLYDLIQALSVLAQPSVTTLRQVSAHFISDAWLSQQNSQQQPFNTQIFQSSKEYSTPHQETKLTTSRLLLQISLHILHITYSVPPWLFSSPNIILSLTKFLKRSTPPFVYRSHFQEIIYSYTNPTICYTDASKPKDKAGFAFSINNCTQAHRHRNTASSFTTEL